MNKRLVSSIATIAILLLLGGLLWLNSDSREQGKRTTLPNTPKTSQISNDSTAPQAREGSYQEYSEARLAEATGTKILFFHASWCPQCRALEADIKKQGVPEGITIFKVDYDNSQALRKKYGVTLQTTVVKVNDQGNLISKFTPYQNPTLENALSNL